MTLSIIIASLSGLLSLMITKSSAYSSSHGQWTTSFTFSRQSFHHDGKKKWDKCWSLVDCDTKGFTELIVNTNILGTNIHGLELAPPAVIIYATIPEGPAAFLGFIFFMLFWIMSSISATSVYCFSSSLFHHQVSLWRVGPPFIFSQNEVPSRRNSVLRVDSSLYISLTTRFSSSCTSASHSFQVLIYGEYTPGLIGWGFRFIVATTILCVGWYNLHLAITFTSFTI